MKAKLVKEKLNEGRNVTITNDAGEPIGTDYQYDATDPEYHEFNDIKDGPDQGRSKFYFGKFNNIDWQAVHEILVINTKLAEMQKISDGKLQVMDVTNMTDYDGYLSEPELYQLEAFDIIYIDDNFPIIEYEKYLNFDTFKAAVAKIWDKEAPIYDYDNRSEY